MGAEPARSTRASTPATRAPRGASCRRGCCRRRRSSSSAWASLAVFLVAVYQLDPLVHWLWPIPVVGFVVYPYLKRWTWLATSGSARSTDSRRSVPGRRSPGTCPGRPGRSAARSRSGSPASTSSTRCSTSRSTARRGLQSVAVRFGERGVFLGARLFHLGTVALLVAAGAGLDVGVFYWLGVAAVAGLLAYEHLARAAGRSAPARHRVLHHERGHLRHVLRLRARGRARVIRAAGLEKRYGAQARAARPRLRARARRVPRRHGPERRRQDDAAARLCAGLAIPSGGTLEVEPERGGIGFLGHEPLVYRELTALENLDLYGRLYRVPERRERIGMLLERFGLWDSRGVRAARRSREASCSGWRSAARCCTGPSC